jgi:hypothetical protein
MSATMTREDVIQLARECGFSVGIGSPALPKFTALIEKAVAEERERLDFIEEHCRCDPKMDGQHVWWPTSFNTAQLLKGPTLREAIDNAIRARKDNT